MANPKILASDVSSWVFSSASGTDASYPLTNLSDYYPDTLWKSADGSAVRQHLAIDLGSAQNVNGVVVQGGNFFSQSDLAVTIQGASNSTFTTSLTSMGTISAGTASDPPIFVGFTSTVSRRYWRLLINGTVLGAAPSLGNIFLGTTLDFTTPYEFGVKDDNPQYDTSESIALDGRIRSSQSYMGRYVWELMFRHQTDALAASFKTFMTTVRGRLRPFYFIDTDGTTVRYMLLTEDYVPVTSVRFNQNELTLKMKEQLANR